MGKREIPRWRAVARAGIVLGFALLIVGFIVRDIRARAFVETDYVALGLWIAGGMLVAGGIALDYRSLLGLLGRRRTAEGLNFALVVTLALAMAGLLCYISTRRFARMDWTGKGKHRLHSQTENILRALDRDVKVTVVHTGNEWELAVLDRVRDLLEEFKARTGRMTTEELNWAAPANQARLEQLLRKLGEESLPGACAVFATAGQHQVIPFNKIVEAGRGPRGGPASFKGEAAFAGALTKLTEMKKTILYALTGHGEKPLEAGRNIPMGLEETDLMSDPRYSLSRAVKALNKDYYEVKPLELAIEGKVPDDCAVLIVAGPRTPLSEGEIKGIRSYLDDRNGAAIFMVESQVFPNVETNVDELLADYGIRVRTDAVGISPIPDIFGRIVPVPAAPVPGESLTDHPATADLKKYMLQFDQPCPLEIADGEPRPGLRTQSLLNGIPSSWGETDIEVDREQRVQYDPGRDVPPPLIVGVVVEPFEPFYGAPAGTEAPGPRIVVLGSSLSFVNIMVERHPANLYLLLNCVNWMAGKMHMLGIPAKTMDITHVAVSDRWVRASRYLFMGIMPGCIIAFGIGVWLIRRK